MGLFAVLACCLLLSNGFVSVRQGDVTFVDDVLNFNTLGPANPVPRVIHFPESTEDVSSILRALPQVPHRVFFPPLSASVQSDGRPPFFLPAARCY